MDAVLSTLLRPRSEPMFKNGQKFRWGQLYQITKRRDRRDAAYHLNLGGFPDNAGSCHDPTIKLLKNNDPVFFRHFTYDEIERNLASGWIRQINHTSRELNENKVRLFTCTVRKQAWDDVDTAGRILCKIKDSNTYSPIYLWTDITDVSRLQEPPGWQILDGFHRLSLFKFFTREGVIPADHKIGVWMIEKPGVT